MKKRIVGVFTLLLCVVMLLSACGVPDNVGTSEATYTVTFLNYDNSLLYRATDIKEGEPAIYAGETPARPDSTEYTYSFIGWDKDISAIYSNLAVFAKYSETKKTGDNDSNITPTFNSVNTNGKMVAYQGEQQDNEFVCANAINVDNDYYFYYFYLGVISKVPVYISYSYCYTKDIKSSLNFSKLSSESFSNSISRSTDTVDTHSYTGGFQVNYSREISAELTIEFAKIKASSSLGLSTDHHWTNEWGTTVTDSQSRTSTYLTEYSEGYSFEVDWKEANGFTKDNYYRMAFYETVSAYGVLVYEVATNTYSTTTDFLIKSASPTLIFEESSTGAFDYQQDKGIEFDVDAAIAYAETHKLEDVAPPQDPGDTTYYAGGHGTSESPYLISTATHLKNIAKHTGSYFKLIDDIDCGANAWTPISSFSGTLDGQNHTISNVSCTNSGVTTATNYGFITTLNTGASIKNISFENVIITADYSGKNANGNYEDKDVSVGCVVAINRGTIKGVNVYSSKAKIDSVGSTAGDNAKRYYASVGGICGRNYSTIEDCYVGDVELLARSHITRGVGQAFAGGLVGYLAEGATMNNVSASGCHIDSYVHSTSSKDGRLVSCAGGIVGAWIGNAVLNATPSDVIDTYILADYDGSAHPRTRYYYGYYGDIKNGGSYIYGYKGAKFNF